MTTKKAGRPLTVSEKREIAEVVEELATVLDGLLARIKAKDAETVTHPPLLVVEGSAHYR